MPFILQTDPDFQSEDGTKAMSDNWLEIPLATERPNPVRLAVSFSYLHYVGYLN